MSRLIRLFEAMQQLQTKEDFYRFFEDISTISEIKALAQRMAVAKMLDQEQTCTHIFGSCEPVPAQLQSAE